MRETYELKVHLALDDESGRWYVSESDVPGLRLEADDPLTLIERIKDAAPELIELNLDEIVEACRARQPKAITNVVELRKRSPAILPIFDNPMQLAHA